MNQKPLNATKGAAITALVLTGLTVVFPKPAAAIFGIGDIVFDPSSWASLGSIWSQDITNGLKLEEEVAQAVKIYNNAVQVYNLAQQEAAFIQNKQIYQAIGVVAQHAAVANKGGETSGWDRALTTAGGLANAAQAWQRASAPGSSMQARVNLADSLGIDALNVIGSCHDAAGQNNGALQNIETFAMDSSQGSNTAVSQANAGDLAQVQMLRTQQCQHAIANEQLKQKLIENLRQRDIESDQITFAQNAAAYVNTENNAWAGGAASFAGYRIP
jgi:hypothetical protein